MILNNNLKRNKSHPSKMDDFLSIGKTKKPAFTEQFYYSNNYLLMCHS